MTLSEINRAVESRIRVKEAEAKERASFDYILGLLIGKSVGQMFDSRNSYPRIEEVYPSLFEEIETQVDIQEQKDKLSVLRFKQFAQSFNQKFKQEGGSEG